LGNPPGHRTGVRAAARALIFKREMYFTTDQIILKEEI